MVRIVKLADVYLGSKRIILTNSGADGIGFEEAYPQITTPTIEELQSIEQQITKATLFRAGEDLEEIDF